MHAYVPDSIAHRTVQETNRTVCIKLFTLFHMGFGVVLPDDDVMMMMAIMMMLMLMLMMMMMMMAMMMMMMMMTKMMMTIIINNLLAIFSALDDIRISAI